MNEFSFIHTITQKNYKQHTLIKGIGDDAAVYRETSNDIVTAVDTFVENVHFTRKTMSAFHIGYRALAANLSDIAAMGAIPTFYLVSIVVPRTWSSDKLDQIFSGMKSLAQQYHVDLIGGDTVSGEQLIISITIIGKVERNKARYRNHAKKNDIVFVTGSLGDSQAGLYLLTKASTSHLQIQTDDINYFIKRHRQPTPRIEFARELKSIERMSLNDISDGIANEAAEIAEASKVNIVLNDKQIPCHRLKKYFSKDKQEQWKLFGGEDFELIGTVAPKHWQTVKKIAKKVKINVTKVGYVEYNGTDYGQVFLHKNNRKLRLLKEGYTHLK